MKKPKNKGFLSLTNDLVFKRYFKSDKLVLKSLLEAFLPLPPGRKITGFSRKSLSQKSLVLLGQALHLSCQGGNGL